MADVLPKEEQEALDAKNRREQDDEKEIKMGQGGNESDEDEEEESSDEEPEYPGYKEMFYAKNARPFLGKSWVVFSSFFAIYYLLQFGLALMCANFYSQSTEIRLSDFEMEYEKKFDDGTLP